MANESLIAYQQQLKQRSLDDIAVWNQTLTSINQAIDQMNINIDNFNIQKADFEQKIADAEAGNVLIDQTIDILSA